MLLLGVTGLFTSYEEYYAALGVTGVLLLLRKNIMLLL